MTSAHSIQRNMAWNSIGNFVYLVSQYALTYITTRSLGFEQAGIFSLAISIGNTMFTIASYSMRYYQASDVSGEFTPGTYIVSRLLTSGISLIATFIFFGFTTFTPYYLACIGVYVLFKCFEALSDVYQGILQLGDRMDYIGKAFLLKAGLETLVFTGVVIASRSLLVGLISITVVAFLILIGYEIPSSHTVMAYSRPSFKDVRAAGILLTACFFTAAYGMMFGTIPQVSRYALQALRGAEALGFYASVAMPVVAVQVLCQYIFAPLVTPLATELRQPGGGKFMTYSLRIVVSIAVISVAALLAATWLGTPVMVALYGEKIRPYLYLLNPLIISGSLVALGQFLGTLLIILRKTKTLCLITIPAFIVSVATSFVSIEWWGMNGPTFNFILGLVLFCIGAVTLLVRATKTAHNKE